MQLTHWTRQIRRIQSLKQRLNKKDHLYIHHDLHYPQLQQEWQKILKAVGFYQSFPTWMKQKPELMPFPDGIPTVSYLFTMEQLLKYEADRLSYSLKQKAKSLAQFQQQEDTKRFGKKMAYKRIREPSPGLVQTVDTYITATAEVCQQPQYGLAKVKIPPNQDWDLTKHIQVADHVATIVQAADDTLEIMIHDEVDTLPTQVTIRQRTITSQPEAVSKELSKFWNQYWGRDSQNAQHDITEWPEFQALLQQLPQQPLLAVDMTHLPDWLQAIKATKSTTARGSCGWSPDELKNLPPCCIRDLMLLLDQHYAKGFPTWMMDARVLPVSKQQGATSPKYTRPITILPIIYRLWSRVLARKILDAWKYQLSDSITGFVPGRNSFDFVYRMQLHLEATQHGHCQQHWGGITLDLTKCFNTLPQEPLCHILIRLGVPTRLAQQWIKSLHNMQRHWQVHGQLHPVELATTGVPEGDSLSVTAMLAINQLWTGLLNHPNLRLHAFADNWAYATFDATMHMPTIAFLQKIAAAMALTIDWGKTWGWSTDSQHKDALKQAANALLPPDTTIQQVGHARELGYIMHYRQQPFRGTQKERHAQALKRLKKLQHADYTLEEKSHIISAAALTKALFGTHMYQCGDRYYTQLRSAIARAFVGDHHNVQSHIACTCLSKMNCDPEHHTIAQAIRAARHFLLHADPSDCELFLALAVKTDIRASKVLGPATAFHAYISKLGWGINKQGDLYVSATQTLNLLHSNLDTILDAVDHAWMANVSLSISNRKGMSNIPTPDRQRSRKAIAKLPQTQQQMVAIDMTAGFMLNDQKRHFDPDQPLQCEFCDATDTAKHRVLECPATQVIREPHQKACAFLETYDEIHTMLPLAYKDPEIEFCHILLQTMPPPQIFQPPFGFVDFIYTDGSCKHPKEIETRMATYAVVYPHVSLHALPTSKLTDIPWLLDHAFTTVAVSHVQGIQTVDRAELTAAVLSHELKKSAVVVTDSQYVVDCHLLVMNNRDVRTLHKRPNYDLLKRLHALYWSENQRLRIQKIKAHQELLPAHPDFMHRLGNAVADHAAQLAQTRLARPLTHKMDELRKQQFYFDEHLLLQLQMRADLACMRARLIKDEINYVDPDRPKQLLYDWNPAEVRQFTISDDLQYVAHASRWGTGYTAMLMAWTQTLQWPLEPDTNKPPTGVSWVELAVIFLLTTGRSIPLNIREEGQSRYKNEEDNPGFDMRAHCFTRMVNSFRDSLAHLQYLVQHDIMPTMTPHKVKSICVLGSKHLKQGIAYRPIMLKQRETLDVLMKFLQPTETGEAPTFRNHPDLPFCTPVIFSELPDPADNTLADRSRRYNQRRREIRMTRS